MVSKALENAGEDALLVMAVISHNLFETGRIFEGNDSTVVLYLLIFPPISNF